MRDQTIFKILPADEWERAKSEGVFKGSAIDIQDGYIHFSNESQLQATLDKHFANQRDLVILEVSTESVKDDLRYEVSRDDELFPHLYGDLPTDVVLNVRNVPES